VKRLLTEKQREWLARELNSWKSESIVSADQAQKILGLYETSGDESSRKQSVLLSTLMGLAALMVGLGVFLLIGYNWDEIPRGGKLVLILATIAATYAGAFFAEKRGSGKWMVDVLLFLGCLFYGGGIFLVAQIFHLHAHYPNAFWWWAIGVMPIALCRKSLLIHALYAWLLALWCGMEIINFRDLGFWLFGRFEDFPNGAYSFILLALPGLLAGYREKSAATVSLYVVAITWWLVLQPFTWDLNFEMVYFIGAVGALLMVLAASHDPKSPFARPYRFLGTVMTGWVLILLSYHRINEDVFNRVDSIQPAAIVEAAAIAALAVIALLPSSIRLMHRLSGSEAPTPTLAETIRRQALPISLTLVMLVSLLWHLLFREPVVPTILANLGMLALAAQLIRTGLHEDRGLPFTVGVLYFLLWTILRYIDLFGDFGGMLGAAAMFFLCGAALFFVARYWQRRKARAHA
jgi:uncharacterized membrane protein